ncbi:MAG: MarR family transcriptional regulator [Myxococcales bacterium]|nr:MarR family transcriptional regulator [Myxococcales bacterium]
MADLEELKRRSVLQVLFKAARLANEEGIRRVRAVAGDERIRVAHTALFPHVPFEGIRLTKLADRMGVSKQAVQLLVDELEGMGVFERVPDPGDGRAKLIRWTDVGREGIVEGLGVLGELAEEFETLVGVEAWRTTHETLLKVIEHCQRIG